MGSKMRCSPTAATRAPPLQSPSPSHHGGRTTPRKRCEKLVGLGNAGDRKSQVAACYNAQEAVRELYGVPDYELAQQWIDELIRDMNDPSWPVEVRSLGRTLKRWRNQIIAWHRAHFTNGPNGSGGQLDQASEARAFGLRRFRNYRARALLYAGKPSWELLAAITPR